MHYPHTGILDKGLCWLADSMSCKELTDLRPEEDKQDTAAHPAHNKTVSQFQSSHGGFSKLHV